MKFSSLGTTFEYDDIGNGRALVLVHGFPLDRTLWRYQLEGLQSVARVIAPDLRGFGLSDDAPEIMQMDDYADDLKALINSLNLARPVICGLSMGGYVALAYIAKYPDAVSALILANTRAGADSKKVREGRHKTADKALAGDVPDIAESMLPMMLTEATLAERPTLAEYVRSMMARQRANGVAAALKGMAARPDRTAMLPEIKIPTLIITGSEDTLISPDESKSIHKAIPHSKLVVIPSAAHALNLEQPSEFNTAVKEFIAKLN